MQIQSLKKYSREKLKTNKSYEDHLEETSKYQNRLCFPALNISSHYIFNRGDGLVILNTINLVYKIAD